MALFRGARPTLKSAGKARVTCIRDIIKEIEEEEKNSAACADATSDSATPRSLPSEGVQPNGVHGNGSAVSRQIVVHIPSTGALQKQKHNEKGETKKPSVRPDKTSSDSNNAGSQPQGRSVLRNGSSHSRIGAKSKKSASISEGMCKQNEFPSQRNKRSMSDSNVLGNDSRMCEAYPGQHPPGMLPDSIEEIESGTGQRLEEDSRSRFDDYDLAWEMHGMHFLPKLMTERGSNDFHNVMDEMKSEMKKRRQRRQGFKAAVKMGMMFKGMSERKAREKLELEPEVTDSDFTDEEDEANKEEPEAPKQSGFRRMSRGWKLLNMAVQEEHLRKKKEESTGGWNLIKHTIAHLTDEEKARRDLYERYLNKPNSWAEGLVNYPAFLRDRKNGVNGTHSVRSKVFVRVRPQTAHAGLNGPSHHHATIDGSHGSGRPRIGSDTSTKSTDTKGKPLLRRPKSGHV